METSTTTAAQQTETANNATAAADKQAVIVTTDPVRLVAEQEAAYQARKRAESAQQAEEDTTGDTPTHNKKGFVLRCEEAKQTDEAPTNESQPRKRGFIERFDEATNRGRQDPIVRILEQGAAEQERKKAERKAEQERRRAEEAERQEYERIKKEMEERERERAEDESIIYRLFPELLSSSGLFISRETAAFMHLLQMIDEFYEKWTKVKSAFGTPVDDDSPEAQGIWSIKEDLLKELQEHSYDSLHSSERGFYRTL